MTTIYLSDSQLQVLSGTAGRRATVTACSEPVDISACLFNDTIVDRDGFCRIVTGLFSRNEFQKKNVMLVLHSTQIITREMKVPAKGMDETIAFIANEFSDVERAHDPIFAYSLLARDTKTKLNRVLAIMSDRAYLQNFLELFAECGVQITAVQPALCSAIHALEGIKTTGSACIVQLMEKIGFTSLLLSEGRYLYSSYTRLTSPHETPEFGSEVARSVSNITQFTKAQHLEVLISQVLFAGFSDGDRASATDAIDRMGGAMATAPLPDSGRVTMRGAAHFSDCVFAAGGLLRMERSANLLRSINPQRAARRQHGGLVKSLSGILALLLVMGSATLLLLNVKTQKQKELRALNNYTSSAAVAAKVNYYNQLLAARQDMQLRIRAVSRAQELLASYPIPNSSVDAVLQKCAHGLATVEILQYDSASGELKLNTRAKEVDHIADFIDELNLESIFHVEQYSGYQYNESDAMWSVYVVVSLAPEAGREANP